MIVPVLFFMKIGFKNVDFERAGFQYLGVLSEHREMVAPAEKVGDRNDAIDILRHNRRPDSFFRAYFSGHDAFAHGGRRIQSVAKSRSLQESRANYVGFRETVFKRLPEYYARDVGHLNTVTEGVNIEQIGVGDGTRDAGAAR